MFTFFNFWIVAFFILISSYFYSIIYRPLIECDDFFLVSNEACAAENYKRLKLLLIKLRSRGKTNLADRIEKYNKNWVFEYEDECDFFGIEYGFKYKKFNNYSSLCN